MRDISINNVDVWEDVSKYAVSWLADHGVRIFGQFEFVSKYHVVACGYDVAIGAATTEGCHEKEPEQCDERDEKNAHAGRPPDTSNSSAVGCHIGLAKTTGTVRN